MVEYCRVIAAQQQIDQPANQQSTMESCVQPVVTLPSTTTSTASPAGIVTPEAIKPFPVAARALSDTQHTNRKKRKSVVAISSPYKAELEAADQVKRQKLTPKRLCITDGSHDAKIDSKSKGKNGVRQSGKQKQKNGGKSVKKMTCRDDKHVGRK